MGKIVYLDYAATTPVDKRVVSAMAPYFFEKYGNPSSLHLLGREAKEAVDIARGQIAEILNCSPEEILFTSGGTESDNIAILGVAQKLFADGKKGAFIASEIEHHAVINGVKATESLGMTARQVKVDSPGIVLLDELEAMLREGNVKLVSIMYANNEIGTVQPVREISNLCKKYGALFHVDACQASPYLELDVDKLGVDLMSLNGSKMYGPKGVGMLYVRKGIELAPIVFGGGQEKGLRSGTENVPGIVGLATALSLAQKEREQEAKREQALRDKLIDGLQKALSETILNGDLKTRLPNNANISFLGIEGESLLLELDKAGICVSTGSACSSHSLEPSHVIMAVHRGDKEPHAFAHSSIRFSLGRFTTDEEIDYTIKTTIDCVNKLRGISSAW